ncbi:MAG: ribosomal protein L7/L12 [Paracoccaceae bacterium]
MNRFQWIMTAIAAVCVLVLASFALRFDGTWGQLAFAVLVFTGILLIPSSFFPSQSNHQDMAAFKDLDESARTRISNIAADGRKIEAIKELRAATGLGLADAKGIVDQINLSAEAKSQ